MFASLHEGVSVIDHFSPAADPQRTVDCMRRLGVPVEQKDDTLRIEGVGRDGLQPPDGDLDCGNSGTTMRLLSGILAGAGIDSRLVGDESLSSRTMRRIIDPLEEMGAVIEAQSGDFAPLHITRPGTLQPMRFQLPIPSAQLKSCVLLAGLFGESPTVVVETVTSRDHTERLLELPIEYEGSEKIIHSSRQDTVPTQSYRVPGDFSAAAFWLVAGAIHPDAEIRLKNVGLNPTRTGALDILQQMGANLSLEVEQEEGREPSADLRVASSTLKSINISRNMVPNCIDELPILAVAMLFADGISRISGAEELRHKETDRLKAVSEMLEKVGADFIEFRDGLEIHGDPDFRPEPAVIDSYHDHRIAMSAAIVALRAKDPCRVEGAECTRISYPGFWEHLGELTN